MNDNKMPTPVAWIVSEHNQIGGTSDYLRWNRGRGGAPKSVGNASEALYSAETVQALQAECEEQARLNGMGAEREARVMARVSELQAERDALAQDAERYRWLRAGGMYRVGFDSVGGVSLDMLDAAIDAAMKEQGR